jgi:hypothetical protein
MAFIHSDKKIVLNLKFFNFDCRLIREREVVTDCGNVDIDTSQYVAIYSISDRREYLSVDIHSSAKDADSLPDELITKETMCEDTKWLDVKTY